LDEFRSYESQATINTQFQDGQVVGSRVYERLLVPQVEGDLTIPGLEYTFFNPTSGTYETIQTQAIQISVAPGDDLTARGVTPVPGGGKETVEQIATDIRYLKHLPSRLSTENRPVTSSALYWLAWGIPVLGLIGNVVWQRRQRYWQNNANLARSSRARRKARQAMAQARKTRGDVYSDGAQVLFDYLADKLGQPVAGLTHHALTGVLHDSGVSPELSERVSTCLMEAELGRYSPEAGDPHHADNLLREIDAVMDSLEKVL
jgi:hypothetical protein